MKGPKFPILTIYERAMNLLSLKYVDDVILNSPYMIDENFIKDNKIDLVLDGLTSHNKVIKESEPYHYEIPKKLGILKIIDSGIDFSMDDLLNRVKKNSSIYKSIVEKKLEKLKKYFEDKKANK